MKKSVPLLVYLKKDPKGPTAAAEFGKSIVDVLKNAENLGKDVNNEIYVSCEITDDGLILDGFAQDAAFQKNVLLRRPPFCPIKSLTDAARTEELPNESKERGVNIGVSVLLESSDNNILLTRRSKTMRTFPRVWVPPGGHVDCGESLIQAAMRELEEETGIFIGHQGRSTSILGLWESAFPPVLHLGLPRRHHIVVYLHHKSEKTAAKLSGKIELETKEVDACAWICSCAAKNIISTDSQFESAWQNTPRRCISASSLCVNDQEYLDGILVMDNAKTAKGKVIPTSPLLADVGETQDNERTSTGTKYALNLWLDMLENRNTLDDC